MATQASDEEVKSGGKRRLARAKVKRTEKVVEERPKSDAARAKQRKEKVRNAVIAVFAVVMAISMMLPSLSGIVSNNRQNVAAEADAEAAAAEDADEESSDATGMDKVDENYTTTIEPLEAKLKEDPKDLATILNLGNDYMSWAYAASSYSDDDESKEHVNDLFEKAIDYFDQYLKLNDSVAVKVSRAMCVFYSSDSTDEGIEDMVALTESDPDYAPAWGNLGLLYEQSFDIDKAKETYKKAAEVDADDTYGVRSFANGRLASLNSSSVERPSQTLTSTTPTDIGTESGSTLTSTLLSESKTSF